MEKAIETDWRCQSTTWKFLQMVGIAVIGKRRMREEEEVEGKKIGKIIFAIELLVCAQPTNTVTHQVTTLKHFKPHHIHVCGQIEFYDCFETCAPNIYHFSLFTSMLPLCFARTFQCNCCKLESFFCLWIMLGFFNGQHQYGTSGTIRSW